jgi:uncharacterized protein YidB (DUF937 family)
MIAQIHVASHVVVGRLRETCVRSPPKRLGDIGVARVARVTESRHLRVRGMRAIWRRGASMGLFDKVVSGVIKGLVRNVDTAAIPGLTSQYLAKTELGDAAGLIERLRQGGLDREVESWLGPGPNLPVSPDQLRSALGEDVLEQFAAATGLPADKLLALMVAYLPQPVDAMSSNGTIEDKAADSGDPPLA